jgi:hypothetical protein
MQAGVGGPTNHLQGRIAALVGFLLVSGGCGGGTTGTSPGESFKLLGVTESSNQAPLADTSMSVISGSDEEVLLESQTDSNGDFSMELPEREESLVVDVQGTKSALLERQLRGTSIVSTKLRQERSGALSFGETFEVQVDPTNLCPLLIVEGNHLYQQADVDQVTGPSCLVTLVIRTKEAAAANVEADVRSECDVNILPSSTASSSAIVVDVAPLLTSGCSKGEIVVSMRGSRLRAAVFPIDLNPAS